MQLTWLGHSAFHLDTGTHSILIDPFWTGNATFPQAAAGNVCIYEADRLNTAGGIVNEVNRSGATIFINSTAGGGFFSFGTWAVTGS